MYIYIYIYIHIERERERCITLSLGKGVPRKGVPTSFRIISKLVNSSWYATAHEHVWDFVSLY